MGCGSSTTVAVENQFETVNNPNQDTTVNQVCNNGEVDHPTHKHTTTNNVSLGESREQNLQEVTQSSINVDTFTCVQERTTLVLESNYVEETSIPPPRPPDTSREELLEGKHELMRRMDEHADKVPFAESGELNIQDFTSESLIPADTIGSETKTLIVQKDNCNSEVTTEEHKSNRKKKPPLLRQGTRDKITAAELLLDKHKRDMEQAQKLIEVDRLRRNMTLKEKLAQRREMKRKRELSLSVVSEVTAGICIEDIALHSGQQAYVESAVGQVADLSGDLSRTEVPMEESIALANLAFSAEVEADQDRYEAIMAETAPLPVVPETGKEEIYGNGENIELFNDLENFAVNMEQLSDPSTTFAILMEDLLINQLSDLEKVRIIFHWITAQNLNTINFPNNIDEETPMGFLLAIKQNRKSYPDLFCRVCSAAGLHAKVIRGYTKAVGYQPDHKFQELDDFRGSWNAVLIDNQWRLIDTHWGAKIVIEVDDVPITDYETVYKYEEHYFLTNPDKLVVTHYPDEKEWQLLSQPFTIEEFQNMVRVWPLFYKLQLELQDHNGVIEAPEDGIVEIRIRMSDFARQDAKFSSKFMTKQKKRTIGQINLACHVLQYFGGEFLIFQVHVPVEGQYLLRISADSKKFSHDFICFYQINCTILKPSEANPENPADIKPLEIRPPFPEKSYLWGPPPSNNIAHVSPVSHCGPIISCDKAGEATLIMRVPGDSKVRFLSNLFKSTYDGSAEQAILNRTVNFTTVAIDDSKVVVFRVRVPNAGLFYLILYSKTDEGDNYEGFCYYLVASSIQTKPSHPFPSVPSGALGDHVQECNKLNLVPIVKNKYSPNLAGGFLNDFANAWIEPNEEGEAVISFNHLTPLTILAELKTNDNTTTREVTNFITTQDTGKRGSVIIHPPQYDETTTEYLMNIYAAHSQSASIPIIFNSFVRGSRKVAKKLPLSPIEKWGVCNALPDALLSVAKYQNSQPLFDSDVQAESTDPSPCRLYSGGDDFIMHFSMKKRLNLRACLSIFENGTDLRGLEDNNCLLSSIRLTNATLRIRIPGSGEYCLTLYGSNVNDQSGQLSCLMYIRISAVASSSLILYPRTYGLWSSNVAELFYPLSKNLKRNTVNKIRIHLSNLTENTSYPSCEAFPEVRMINESSDPTYPHKSEDNPRTYEWDFVPGPREKIIGVVVKEKQGDSSLSYVMQFDVED